MLSFAKPSTTLGLLHTFVVAKVIRVMYGSLQQQFMFCVLLAHSVHSSATCRNEVVKACQLGNFSYRPGDLKRDWRAGLILESSFHSEDDGIDKYEFGFAYGQVQVRRQDVTSWPEVCQSEHELLVIIHRNFKNIFHWLMDQVFPYALSLRDYNLTSAHPKLVVLDSKWFHPHRAAVFENLSDMWVKITGQDLIDWEDNLDKPLCAKTAYFVQLGRRFELELNLEQNLNTIQQLRPSYAWFSNWLKAKLQIATPTRRNGTRALLIDRSRADYRRLLHSAHVMEALVNRGWDVSLIHFEELNFHQQVTEASNADVLIAPHGAALTNLIFMPSWGVIVELRPHGFGSKTTDFWQVYGNLARAATKSYIAWHDPIDKGRPHDYKGITDFKDFDVAINKESLSAILDVVEGLLETPMTQRNVDFSINMNAPASTAQQ